MQLVAGSAIQAFEEVCPERIDLIHKNYRKLCNLLVDVEEWGQVVIINMLSRYARTQFINPNREVGNRLNLLLTILVVCFRNMWNLCYCGSLRGGVVIDSKIWHKPIFRIIKTKIKTNGIS